MIVVVTMVMIMALSLAVAAMFVRVMMVMIMLMNMRQNGFRPGSARTETLDRHLFLRFSAAFTHAVLQLFYIW